MDKELEKEIQNLINTTINSKKTQFGKAYSEVGSSESNLVLRTKGDIKIQWGGKFIDLIKSGKLATPEFIIKKIKSESDIGSAKGIYIAQDDIFVGNSSDYTNIKQDISAFISYLKEQKLTKEQIELVQKNIGIIYEDENDVKNSGLEQGFVYLKSTKQPYIWSNNSLVPLLNLEKEKVTSFDELQVNKLISQGVLDLPEFSAESGTLDNAVINNLTVKTLTINEERQYKSIDDWDTIFTGDFFSGESEIEETIEGEVIEKTDSSITLKVEDSFIKYKLVYILDTSDEESSLKKDLLCISYIDNTNTLTFNPLSVDCSFNNSNISIPNIVNNYQGTIYLDEERAESIQPNIFKVQGSITNCNIFCNTSNFDSEVYLNNCDLYQDSLEGNSSTTPEETLQALKNFSKKSIYCQDNSFFIKKQIPINSIILSPIADESISDVKFKLNIPTLEVKDSKGNTIGYTSTQDIEISLSQILVNSTQYSWQLI